MDQQQGDGMVKCIGEMHNATFFQRIANTMMVSEEDTRGAEKTMHLISMFIVQ